MRKGQYDVGVNTGECANISSVSFKKRESQEALHDDLSLSPSLKHKRLSPIGKRPHRSHSDAVSPEKLKLKSNIHISPKHTERDLGPSDLLISSGKPSKTSDLNGEPKRSKSFNKYETVKANEYSLIQFEHDLKTRKALDLDKEEDTHNECIPVDDSAVDLDDIFEPGYESLNDVKQRIESKNFNSSVISAKSTDNTKANIDKQFRDNADGVNQVSKTGIDDSALSLSLNEQSLSNSVVDQLTSSSKSRDSGFESSKTHNSPENVAPAVVTVTTEYEEDSEELQLDPGYAECADAIKGILPCSACSESSGSKLSSCQSLNTVLDDIEPDYAECADALKSGSVRMKISVSNERLAAPDKFSKTKSNEHIKVSGSELYANPQILFRKRSKAFSNERSSGEFSNRSSEADKNDSFTFSSSESLQRDLKEDQQPCLAPPLPARNYSLYLENEEAAKLLDCTTNSPPKSVDNATNAKQQIDMKEPDEVEDSPFEDFGYASIEETKNAMAVSKRKPLESKSATLISDTNLNKGQPLKSSDTKVDANASGLGDIEDFGYASVKDTLAAKSCERTTQTEKRVVYDVNRSEEVDFSDYDNAKGQFNHSNSHNVSECALLNNTDVDSFGYASVKESKKKIQDSSENTYKCTYTNRPHITSLHEPKQKLPSEQSVKTEISLLDSLHLEDNSDKGCNEGADQVLPARNSFELEKLKYVQSLEDDFGYTSVKNVKRHSASLYGKDVSESTEVQSSDGISASIQSNNECVQNIKSEEIIRVPFVNLKDDKSDSDTEKENANDIELNLKLDLSTETLNRESHQNSQFNLVKETQAFTTSPISDVVTSAFFCSTPVTKECDDKEHIPVRTSTLFEEDNRLEVTIKEKGGSCRVLKITEKEEPTAILMKRKSIRDNQKGTGRNSIDETSSEVHVKEEFVASCDESPDTEMEHDEFKKEKKKVVSDAIADTSLSENVSINIKFSPSWNASAINYLSEEQSEGAIVNSDAASHLKTSDSSECAVDSGLTNMPQTLPVLGKEVIRLPVRSNLQKVSYRSATDSDESDDSDLKLENLPKLEIDESVFVDSDSGESCEDKNKSELSKQISDITQQIEQHLNTSEDTNEPIHMTLEEVLRRDLNISDVTYSNSGANSIPQAVAMERDDLQSDSENETKGSVDSAEIQDEKCKDMTQTLHPVQTDSDDTSTKIGENLETESVKVPSDLEDCDVHHNLHNLTELSKECEADCLADFGASQWNEDGISVPPRPPPPMSNSMDSSTATISDNELMQNNSGEAESDQRDSDNVEDMPLSFRPGSGSISDTQEGDSPPAIPPRVRIRKHVRQG